MHASRSMLSLLPLCAVALLLVSPASADPAVPGPFSGDDTWPPAAAPVQVALPLDGTEDKRADDGITVLPPGRQLLRPAHHHAALSPEAKQKLDHEARCGPRVPVRPGFPWPARNPRCRGGGDGAAGAPEKHPLYYPFPIWNP